MENSSQYACLGSSTGDMSYDDTANITAPADSGVYFLNSGFNLQYGCQGSSYRYLGFAKGGLGSYYGTLATIIVP